MQAAAVEVQRLLVENLDLFGMTNNQDSPYWKAYVSYIDNIVYNNILGTVGCRFVFLLISL